ncbi:MAG TPA: alkaline phosphatase PhoX, partial [Cytophagales bacterium]|nr:alkaline phosphatase PhoX [Cytophagales bacterium]
PYTICEAFLIDLSVANPSVDDLKLFFAGSRGAEVTGACFTPDAQTIFINNQHPEDNATNDPRYAKSATIALRLNTTTAINDVLAGKGQGLNVHPNPSEGRVTFNKSTTGALFHYNGTFIKNISNATEMDFSDLNAGVYFFKSTDNEVTKIILK